MRAITPKAVNLPPYGLMDQINSSDLQSGPLVPPDWRGPDESSQAAREREWLKWRNATIDLLKNCLWPIWDPQIGWDGEATAFMHALTVADIELLLDLQKSPHGRQLDKLPESPVRSLDCPTNMTLFKYEDQQDPTRRLADYYNVYDRTLDDKTLSAFPLIFKNGYLAKEGGTASLQMKKFFQRPRPFQMAFLLGYPDLTHEWAVTSMTPSVPCGHCFQGMMAVGGIMERILLDGIELSKESWAALEQYSVDIGDRRVMANVHYPSDNLSSWIIVMRLAPYVFRVPQVKSKLWNAILNRSFVFRGIQDWCRKGHDAPYRRALQELESAAHQVAAVGANQ